MLGIITIEGDSMYPTLKHGKTYIATDKVFPLEEGKIYAYTLPDGKIVIKRLKHVVGESNCYFLGDNPVNSRDSRHYGYIHAENIKAKLLRF